MLALVHLPLAAIGPQRSVVRQPLHHIAQQRVQLGGQDEAGQVGREDVGEAAPLHQKITLSPHIRQHVGQHRRQPDHEHHRHHRQVAHQAQHSAPSPLLSLFSFLSLHPLTAICAARYTANSAMKITRNDA